LHGNPETGLGVGGQEAFRQAPRLATKNQMIPGGKFLLPIQSGGLGRKIEKAGVRADCFESVERRPNPNITFLPIVHPRTPEGFLIKRKPEWLDQMQPGSRRQTKPGNIPGIGRYLRLNQDNVKKIMNDEV